MLVSYSLVKTRLQEKPWKWFKNCWQKFAISIPKNIRTCLDKQGPAGSYVSVKADSFKQGVKLWDCNFKFVLQEIYLFS